MPMGSIQLLMNTFVCNATRTINVTVPSIPIKANKDSAVKYVMIFINLG